MKGLILSGGKGTRLRPITHTGAKQLVPVANKPILFYGIEAIRDAGIEQIGIVVGDTHREIREAVGDGSRWGVKITYIEQEAPLGLAHAVMVSEDFLREEPFVMYLGDNLIIDGISSLVDEFRNDQPNSQILLARVPNPGQFGVAELSGGAKGEVGKVVKLEEKPKKPKSDLALVGVYMFDKNVFNAVKAIKPSNRGELEITDAIQWLIDQDYMVNPHIINGWWKDTGKLEDILEANRMILDTLEMRVEGKVDKDSRIDFKVVIEPGAEVVRSNIRGPAIIGKDSRIIDSYIGPFTSVNCNTEIRASEIEHSIIMENCRITDVGARIEGSLIGRDVEVSKSEFKPRAYRLMLGDNSRIGII
ncbi:MAG: glucose-1-phosphate thymidylyltransferase [Deltaproteobacteria bacterium]|nr:MAG: glucose-1-phosphate thymidylyltransferase [Deltaproteobacteria bacterium]